MFTALFLYAGKWCKILTDIDKEILKVLVEAGNGGISVHKISHHVYNACNSLFQPLQLSDVHTYVLQYLQKNSKSPSSLICRAESRGVYFLNIDNQESQQLMLDFSDRENILETEDRIPDTDTSLSLF